MGCFSVAEVQQASAHVCAVLASTGQEACMALLDADVGSMLQQHIKSGETTLRMFEDAANILSAIVSSAGEVCACCVLFWTCLCATLAISSICPSRLSCGAASDFTAHCTCSVRV